MTVGSEVIGRRCIAAMLDLMASLVIVVFVLDAVRFRLVAHHHHGVAAAPSALLSIAIYGLFLAAGLLYWGCFEMIWRTTPGKALFNLRVVAAGGGLASRRQIAMRAAARAIDALPSIYLVGLIAVLASGSRGQRVGDRLAGTHIAVQTQ
jgi:uncharacterized RDD family membrane protein YckC